MEEKCVEGRAERRLLEVGEEDEDEEEQYEKRIQKLLRKNR